MWMVLKHNNNKLQASYKQQKWGGERGGKCTEHSATPRHTTPHTNGPTDSQSVSQTASGLLTGHHGA